MSYITNIDVIDEIGGSARVLEAIDDDNTGAMDADNVARLNRIIQTASNAVDGYLAGRYIIPLSVVPPLVLEATLVFACEKLFGRRRQGPDEKNPYTARATDMRNRLKRISDREESLDAVERPAFVPGAIIARPSALEGSSL